MLSTLILPLLISGAYAQLDTLAKAAGLKYFGTATDNGELTDTAYLAVLSNTSEWGQITPGNTQKWDTTESTENTFSFTKGDVITALAATNGQLLRCHNLVWYSQLPSWVSSGTWTNATLQAVMVNHITTEVTHYKGQCYAWDVVNEALTDSATFRTSVFYNAMGEDYIRIAFEAAAAADPDVKLYYNDYNIETAGAKSTAALSIVKNVQAAGVKIDGVGFQAHFIEGSSPTRAALRTNLEAYTALGLEVAITELDVRIVLPTTDANLAQQSTDYSNVVGACVDVDGCVGVTVWDFDDKVSWVPSTFSGSGAACLFDDNLARKPAYYGIVAVLQAAAATGSSTGSSTSSSIISVVTTKAVSSTPIAIVASSTKATSTPIAIVLSTTKIATSTTARASGMTTSYIKSSSISSSTEIAATVVETSKISSVTSTTPSVETTRAANTSKVPLASTKASSAAISSPSPTPATDGEGEGDDDECEA